MGQESTRDEEKKQMMPKELENAQQNKKALKVFGVFITMGAAAGFVLGMAGTMMQDHYDKLSFSAALGQHITLALGIGMPILMLIAYIAVFAYDAYVYKRTNREWKEAQELEDEQFEAWYEQADGRMTRALGAVSSVTILNYFGFSAAFYAQLYCEGMYYALFLLALVILILTLIFGMKAQRRSVDLTKLINPEKSGSIYDLKFQDRWIESCDEMEQAMIYKAAFQAYKVTSNVCVVLWMVFTILSLVIKLSLWPVTIVSFIWGLLNVTYMRACKQFSREKSKAENKKEGGIPGAITGNVWSQ